LRGVLRPFLNRGAKERDKNERKREEVQKEQAHRRNQIAIKRLGWTEEEKNIEDRGG
jgi:hypothetical protein